MRPTPDYMPSGTLESSIIAPPIVISGESRRVQVELPAPMNPEGPWDNSQTLSAKILREQASSDVESPFPDFNKASLSRVSKTQRSSKSSKVKEGPSTK